MDNLPQKINELIEIVYYQAAKLEYLQNYVDECSGGGYTKFQDLQESRMNCEIRDVIKKYGIKS